MSKPVWDVPTRLMHWGIVAAFTVSWAGGEFGGPFVLHLASGFTLLALMLLRLVWGFVGAPSARFSNWPLLRVGEYFAAIKAGKPIRWPGHGPLASWWAAGAMLLLLAGPATGIYAWSTEGFALGEGDEAAEHEEGGESEEEEARERGGAVATAGGEAGEGGEGFSEELHEIPVNLMILMIVAHLIGIAKESYLLKEPVALGMVTGGKLE